MKKATKQDIQKIAGLAKLKLSESELDKYENEFNDILDYVGKVMECDVDGIEEEHNLENYKDEVMQDDEPVDAGISRDEYLQNATDGRSKNGYVVSSRVVGGEE
ncbi:Asp-tRNA(Asn)/Glu-tRNA(Gln) amidotransferase subunit GatC [Candidatus Dojkabacteria bacterium]|uniref:Asp-tRNA(Asn)/Glu-tRNA(Gln) amidotransferase subunit GatC n=1 Tax=Candidatus Dojkabacteria bacterium TaxID=2099670 RepID=A0A955IAF9_9BACT|nr:Asp-tRNA(Asn)/Glu-tRNA(Gln) amidotransferase subunit GatC [Candidatus Dojkabacteria bacterium]